MSENRLTNLVVGGMSCHSCVRHVDHALRDLEGVSAVDVRLREGRVHVEHDPQQAPVAALIEALTAAGYSALQDATGTP